MSDYERRPNQGPSYNSRKRRFRDDEDQDRRGPRRRVDNAPPHLKLRRQLLSIADSTNHRWQDEARSIAYIVCDNYEESTEVRTVFNELLFGLVVEQPLKIPFLSYALLVINTTKSGVLEKVIPRITDTIQDKIKAGDWQSAKLFLRLLACLQPVLSASGVFPILDELFNRAGALQSESSDDTIGTELVKIILLTLPYIMSFSAEMWKTNAAELMEKTDIIASEPHALQAMIDPLLGDDGKDNGKGASIVSLLQKQLQSEADNGWPLAIMPRPWIASSGDCEMQDKIEGSTKHDLPEIKIPEQLIQGPRGLFPEIWFSVYSGQEIDTVPPTTTIASTVFRDVLVDTINNLDFNRYSSARAMIEVDNYFAHHTFAKRNTTFDRLRELDEGKSTWKPEDVIVDTVFSQIFQLPAPKHKMVYYHSVLTEACKVAPAAIAPSLGRAIRYLYRHTANMDLELSQCFIEWFAHHLSNFGFTWKWQEWVDDVQFSEMHPRKSFIVGAIDREIRLSFSQRIKGTLPDVYKDLISNKTEMDEPDFKFNDPETLFSAEGIDMAALLRRKADDEAFQPIFNKIQTAALDMGTDPLVASVDVLMTSVCWVGSKSLSHGIACIERVKAKLTEFASASEAARCQLITSIAQYWTYHPGTVVALIDRLLNIAVLTPTAVVEWALTGAGSLVCDGPTSTVLSRALVFEIVVNTVNRVILRLHQPLEASELKPTPETLDNLFKAIYDGVDKIQADPTADEEGVAAPETWKARWMRVFKRKEIVQKALAAEKKLAKEIKEKEEEELAREAQADIEATAAAEQD
ncbi:Nuclear cap-binding protein subunit 1 [Ceratocystis fimbriata CBS 114723]|uniref:Nuclear cap-binding protein subunit 1 n=1 Tax=Ceratocystis fimbriata CBS 114723 TaxID=1035309 RepID=A0A2C5X7X8_9PEZI|nr:Nuclear cap-binding protein subunit 1 [Ceratocystis fimbriata CBS 114723]